MRNLVRSGIGHDSEGGCERVERRRGREEVEEEDGNRLIQGEGERDGVVVESEIE